MKRTYCDVCETHMLPKDPRYSLNLRPLNDAAKQPQIVWMDVCGFCASQVAQLRKGEAA